MKVETFDAIELLLSEEIAFRDKYVSFDVGHLIIFGQILME